MKESLESRLKDLREQFAAGQQVMAELGKKQDELRSTLLRISGAVQVLEELLGHTPAHPSDGGAPPARG